MPTREERQEVARKLKSFYETLFIVENMNMMHFVRMVFGSCGLDTGENSPRDFVGRLIDLIEPEPELTCNPVCVDREDQNGRMHHLFHRCSECGHDLPYEAELGHCNFCPNCGAKVVEDA